MIQKLQAILSVVKIAYSNTLLSIKRFFRCLKLRAKKRRHARRIKSSKLLYTHCKNCGHELKGKYCHACGQFASDINPSIDNFVWQYFENAFQFDGRAWMTIRNLFIHPGRLSSEFMAGHIRRYVFPLKLYMAVAVIFSFVILAVNDNNKDEKEIQQEIAIAAKDSIIYNQILSVQQLDSTQTARLKEVLNPGKIKKKNEKLSRSLISSSVNFAGRVPIIMMFAMPMFALFSMLFYRKRYKRYLPHLIFSIHVHTVFFLTIMLMLIMGSFYSTFVLYLLWAIFIWVVIYGYTAAKRFYGDGWGKVLFKNICLYSLYYVFCLIIFVLGFLINLCYDSWASGDGFMTPLNSGTGLINL